MANRPINIYEFEALSNDRLPKQEYDFIAGGATDEITLRRTREVFDSIMLRPKMLVDISQMDLSTTVQGQRIEFPVMADPSGGHGRAHPDGELATVRAAGAMGTALVLSSGSSYTLEEVASVATGPIWWQQYLYSDRGLTMELADRAKSAGYSVLCITLDSTVQAKRERNIRNDYSSPPSPNYAHLELNQWQRWDVSSDAPSGVNALIDRKATWSYLEWLAGNTSMPVVVKGVMTGEDGRLAAEHGAKGIIVSNHGARQLDTTFASVEALPEVVRAVEGRAEVYLDGGIRRGTDVLKALALGARAVLMGRPLFWGLSVDGEEGVKTVMGFLRDELGQAMGMCGRPTIDSIDTSLIGIVSPLQSVLSPPAWPPTSQA
ncbi:MAG: alpha-hydroxy-acid oxidizing protein [Dehalococcoidia bacterium]|nr:alpha-hydroxy-acid oxidizing protein [Dehalococcoidia bacterium]